MQCGIGCHNRLPGQLGIGIDIGFDLVMRNVTKLWEIFLAECFLRKLGGFTGNLYRLAFMKCPIVEKLQGQMNTFHLDIFRTHNKKKSKKDEWVGEIRTFLSFYSTTIFHFLSYPVTTSQHSGPHIHFRRIFIFLCIELCRISKSITNSHSQLLQFGYKDSKRNQDIKEKPVAAAAGSCFCLSPSWMSLFAKPKWFQVVV